MASAPPAGNPDPFDLLHKLWAGAASPLPGFVAPTLDADELTKRIADLRSVETWLKGNLDMLQMSIQALEVQRATVQALRQLHASPDGVAGEPGARVGLDAFLKQAMQWPWPGAAATPAGEPATRPGNAGEPATRPRRKRTPRAG